MSLNDDTFDALKILHEKLKNKEEILHGEVNRLKIELNNYEKLDQTKFSQINNEYIKLQKKIEHLKWTLKEVSDSNTYTTN